MDWVTVERFWSVEEAQLALQFLQSEDIACRLESSAFACNFWYLANAESGVKLLVAPEQAEQAAALLIAAQHHQLVAALEDYGLDNDRLAVDSPLPGETGEPAPVWEPRVSDDNDDDYDSHPGLLTRLRRMKVLTCLLLLTGG